MLSIGTFAQIGQVTHRMLRHWDANGLLVPAHIDPFTGYRSYDSAQLQRLHRIVALRELGFGIRDIASLLDEGIDVVQLAQFLSQRRVEVEQDYRKAAARLADVERRLQLIERKNHMSSIEIVQKPLSALRLASRSTVVPEQPQIVDFVGPALDVVAEQLESIKGATDTPIALYSMEEEGISVVVGYAYDGAEKGGFEINEFPAEETAFCGVHLGPMSTIHESWQALHEEIVARGHAPSGPCRELYVRADESGDPNDFVVELQQPIRPAS